MTPARWRIALWLVMLLAVLYVAWQAAWALLPFALGGLVAYVLTPVVDRVASLVPARSHQQNVVRRGFAVLAVYLAILLGMTGLGLVIVPIAVDQTAEFIDDFPENRMRAQDQVNEWLDVYRERVPENARERIDGFVTNLGDEVGDRLSERTTGTFDSLPTTLGVIFGFLIVPVWMFYALRDRHAFERNFQAGLPQAVRPDVVNGLRIADSLLGRYLRGQLFLGLVVGVTIFVGLTLLDIDLAIALAIFAGITELIPIIGPWIGALPALVIVAASGDPDKILWVALLFFGVQQVENNLLVPRIQGHAVNLHPAVIILLLAVAGTVFGFLGLLVVVPLTALVRELFWYADHRLRGIDTDEAMARTHVAQRLNLIPRTVPRGVASAAAPAAASGAAPEESAGGTPQAAEGAAGGGTAREGGAEAG